MGYRDEKNLRQMLDFVGLRAGATAAGFVQLCVELNDAGLLTGPALDRIKCTIARQIAVGCPKSSDARTFELEVRARIERVFTVIAGPGCPEGVDAPRALAVESMAPRAD